jgi:malonyl-CoA O-methyltransferase
MINKIDPIRAAFNRSEWSYDDYCSVQQFSGEKLLSFITPAAHAMPRIIDLGCGTGMMTQKLAAAFRYRDFHAIDIANQLLIKATQRLEPYHVNVYEADFDQLPNYDGPFDIIFSNMALHWSTNIHATLKTLSSLLNSNGLLAFSIPLRGTFTELHHHFSLNNFMDPLLFINQLTYFQYDILTAHYEKMTLSFENTLAVLRSIKRVGANCVIHKSHRGLRGKSFINQCNLRELTYVIGHFVVTKKDSLCQ